MVTLSGVPLWVLVLVAALALVALWQVRNERFVKRINRLPVVWCVVLVLAALVGFWLVLGVQYGHAVMHLSS